MDEDQFRQTYNTLNPQRCIFEKAINNRRCDCRYKRTFLIATREGVKCEAPQGAVLCSSLLDKMRHAARFSLKQTTISGPLPHNRELQVQAGGITQLSALTEPAEATTMDIHTTVQNALVIWGTVENIPFHKLVAGIASYRSRTRSRKS